MPAERRASSFATAKPVKTERTHEENQERAYIAASRRSDRSLEARIESARRASEIHKKRTGRALRVTEQDVVNEEMYEEEDDDLPTQYQRLNAHLQTSSWLFNRKLHDYIATQHGVRNMFLNQQFPGHTFQPYSPQFPPNGQSPTMNPSMMPPQTFNPATQGFPQSSQPYSPTFSQQQPQQQGYRHAPYNVPQRTSSHQRSASIPTPLAIPTAGSVHQQPTSTATTPRGEADRRLSSPPQKSEHGAHQGSDMSRPPLSRTTTAQSGQQQQQAASPQRGSAGTSSGSASGQATPRVKSEHASPIDYNFPSMPFNTSSQVLNMNPLTLSLPPESQQFVGSALDPNDPRTSIFMSGSENLAQPFSGTYTYNPNLSPKTARAAGNGSDQLSTSGMPASGMTQTLAPENPMKLDTSVNNSASTTPPSGMMDNMFTSQSLFTPNGFDYPNYFDQYQSDGSRPGNETLFNDQFEENSFVNWDQ